jgi:hypothetical protein
VGSSCRARGGVKLKILSSGTFQYSYPAMTFEMSLRRVKRHKLKNKLTVGLPLAKQALQSKGVQSRQSNYKLKSFGINL